MANLLDPESVLLTCSCSALSPLTRLYFCRHCVKLRCPLCVSHEVDSYYCPNCLENMPSAEAKLKKNRCANCFDCPSCGNTLSTRATAVAVQPENKGNTKDEAKLMQAKKVYYLACGFCRWTSRDIGMVDKTVASGAWQEQDNPATKRVNTLVEYYRQLAQKEKLEREKKKLSRRRNYLHLADKFGLSIRRRTSSLSFLTANLSGKGKELADEEVILKEPSVAEEEVETLPPELYTKTLELEQIPMLSQRLCQPDFQPSVVNKLYPKHKHLLAKRSQRCRECEHNLSKPEFNPSSIKFKIQLGAVHYVPRLRVTEVPSLKHNKEVQVTLSMTNPVENVLKISLLSVDHEEKGARDNKEKEKETEEENKSVESSEKKNEEDKDESSKEQKIKDGSDNKEGKEKDELTKDVSTHDTKRADRRVNNKCTSLEFEDTAEVILPTTPLMLAARDEAAEFDESDSAAEMFTDDPRVVCGRQANRIWFYVKVIPKKQTGDVKFSLLMQYEYKHTTSALVRGNQQPQEELVALKHKFHINLGPAEGGTEV